VTAGRGARADRKPPLRILGRPLGVARVDASPEFIQIQFVPHPPLDPAAVMKLVQKQRWKLTGPTKLRVERVTGELPERATAVRQVMDALATAVLKQAAAHSARRIWEYTAMQTSKAAQKTP
jgi:hypothetical protein